MTSFPVHAVGRKRVSEHEWLIVGESVPASGKEYWVWWLGFPPTWAEFRARYEDIPAHWLFDGGGAEPFDGGRVTHYMPYYTPEPPVIEDGE